MSRRITQAEAREIALRVAADAEDRRRNLDMGDEPTYDYVERGKVERLEAEVARLRAVRDAAETLFASLAPKDAPIKVPTQTLIDINNLGLAIVEAREAECFR